MAQRTTRRGTAVGPVGDDPFDRALERAIEVSGAEGANARVHRARVGGTSAGVEKRSKQEQLRASAPAR